MPEEIFARLRQADVLLSQGKSVTDAAHAGVEAVNALAFQLNHSMGADQQRGIPLHPTIKRMRADAQATGNISNGIAPLSDLLDRIQFELFGKIGLAHDDLLASFLGGKVSKNPGLCKLAIHVPTGEAGLRRSFHLL